MFAKSRWLIGLVVVIASLVTAADFPRVASDLSEFEAAVAKMQATFAAVPGDAADKEWVKKKLQHMVDVDQYLRNFTPRNEPQYTKEEREHYQMTIFKRWQKIDRQNTDALKALLKTHSWFKISEWGQAVDQNAWLLVQHSDHDRAFQKEVLVRLEKLYPIGETRPGNYAYLYDRVAVSWQAPTQHQLQRYGTQGRCVGPGKWEPDPIEDPDNVDARRAAVGLPPLKKYIEGFKEICK